MIKIFNRNSFFLYFIIFLYGVLFIFFYQVLVNISYVETKFEVDFLNPDSHGVIFLSGWRGMDSSEKSIWSTDKSASFSIWLSHKTGYRFETNIFIPDLGPDYKIRDGIDVYVRTYFVQDYSTRHTRRCVVRGKATRHIQSNPSQRNQVLIIEARNPNGLVCAFYIAAVTKYRQQ